MASSNHTADPVNVVQALVYALLGVFDAARDLHQTLKRKEKRDHEQKLRSKGYPITRNVEHIDDDELHSDESILLDKAAVTRQFEIGFHDIGSQFSIGDVCSETALQAQIITLQSVIITTFLYGPTSSEPISHHLSSILAACRAAGTICVHVLQAQHQRQLVIKHPPPRSTDSPIYSTPQKPPSFPLTPTYSITSNSTTLASASRYEPATSDGHTGASKNSTNVDVSSRHTSTRASTESTSLFSQTSYDTQESALSGAHYCLYARDLQQHPSQVLHLGITNSSPYCPYCKRALHLSPGKSWEIFKDDGGVERCFQIQNRFVVKCHREGIDGGYSCILCSRSKASRHDTVCGDVKALIQHIWMDHDVGELEKEQDAVEVVERRDGDRGDSGWGFSESRGSRRSASLGPSRSRGRRYE